MRRTAPDLTGQTFGRLKVIALDGYKKIVQHNTDGSIGVRRRPLWLCECSCGGKTRVPASSLLSGGTKSCGCLRREKAAQRMAKIGSASGGVPRIKLQERPKTIGDCMRKARAAAGLTQEQLAEKAGVLRGTLAQLERDEHQGGIRTIARLADALNISIDEYIGHEVKKEVPG